MSTYAYKFQMDVPCKAEFCVGCQRPSLSYAYEVRGGNRTSDLQPSNQFNEGKGTVDAGSQMTRRYLAKNTRLVKFLADRGEVVAGHLEKSMKATTIGGVWNFVERCSNAERF